MCKVYVEELRRWTSVPEAVALARASVKPEAEANPIARQLAVLANAACTVPHTIANSHGLLVQFGIDPATVSAEVLAEAVRAFNRMEPLLEPNSRLLKKTAKHGAAELDVPAGDVPSPVVKPSKGTTRKVTRASVFGYSITAVIRWCGKNGWNFEDTAVMCATNNAAGIADVTIRLQLKAGKDGLRGPAAPITPAQAKQLRKMAS
jgi:hypothetical protein